jgi:hypothetical protein
MHSRKRIRSRWAHANTPEAKRRRRAKADARREALAATLPPVCAGPEPLSHWQTVTLYLYVPTSGRCDQHAVVMDGQRVGLLSATQIGVLVRKAIRNRPSVALLADLRRVDGYSAKDEADAAQLATPLTFS